MSKRKLTTVDAVMVAILAAIIFGKHKNGGRKMRDREFIDGNPVRVSWNLGVNPVDGTTASVTARVALDDGRSDDVSYTVKIAFDPDTREASYYDPDTRKTVYVDDWDGGGSTGLMESAHDVAVRELREWVEVSNSKAVKERDDDEDDDCDEDDEEC